MFQLKNVNNYILYSSSIFPESELVEFDVRACIKEGVITSIAATAGCLLVGMDSGSVFCFKLGSLHHTSPGTFKSDCLMIICSATIF